MLVDLFLLLLEYFNSKCANQDTRKEITCSGLWGFDVFCFKDKIMATFPPTKDHDNELTTVKWFHLRADWSCEICEVL